jgi:glutathione S-transferase
VVPVIDDGEFRLRESNTIVRYLADKHGRADLYSKDLKERATIESWMDWASTEFAGGMRPVFHALIVKNPAYANMVESAAKEWGTQMRVLDEHLSANGPHVLGKNFTIADIPVGLVVNRWFSIAFQKPEFKAVSAYYDQLAQRPPYKAHGRNGTP